MRVYKATVIDKVANPTGEEPASYESYVAVGTYDEVSQNPKDYKLPDGFTDEDIHFYFDDEEWAWLKKDGKIEQEDFTYLIGEEVA